MSGDVQPRKRKDKKKKKDELSLDEPRGTAAALGEGDVFMHSYHEHGTGGHWCAKLIFFSLLAVLITLIGLIILENRGLSELEANSVESRYSGILEGWLEDAPDDDHHDEHTLELKHHDNDEDEDHDAHDEYERSHEHEDEDEHGDVDDENGDEDDREEDDEHDDDENEHGDDEDEENGNDHRAGDDEDENEGHDEDEENYEQDSRQDLDDADDEDEDDTRPYKYYYQDDDEDEKDEDQDDGDEDQDEYEQDQNDDENEDKDEDQELDDDDDDAENGNGVGGDFEDEIDENLSNDDEDDEKNEAREEEDEHEDEEEDDKLEVEKIEQEASEEDQEPISIELPALPEEDEADDGKDDNEGESNDSEADDNADDEADGADSQDDDDFLEADDEPPIIERITAPAGKPYVEVEEDEDSTEKPPDTLEEEEEYEKQQEEKRKEEEQSSHMWLKLTVGGALLLATHAVMRRATAPRDEAEEERVAREATPVDRRMTLIPEEVTPPVIHKKVEEPKKRVVAETVRQAPVFKAPPPPVTQPESEEEDIEEPEEVEEEELEKEDEKAELYSDEDIDEHIVIPQKAVPKHAVPPKPKPEPEPGPDDDVPDDVEIIDDEQIDEEVSEEEDEEEISDVDDAELLSRLEAKYGRLPELERAGQKHKDGGNSVEDDWPGEPADAFWRDQLDSTEQQLRQGAWSAAMERANSPELQRSARAKYIIAASLDRLAEAQRDNRVLSRAIAAYLEVLKMSEHLSDTKLLDVAKRALDRIQFRGNYLNAEPVYRLLIRRFPDEPGYRNNLTISYLMANRADLAEDVLKETLTRWPDNRVALAHYGFVLKVNNNKLEEAVEMFEKALKGDSGPACEPRFYYHYGDALLLLGQFKEADEVHKRGAKLGLFLSSAQRSLYNVPRLTSKPWWNVEETPYLRLAKSLERSWKDILKEGEAAKALYEKEKEGLKERGEWSQMDLFVRGQELPGRCNKAPVTCSIVKSEIAAAGCRRGQIKFSAMEAGTHVRPHVGPTNCRLRMHLGLSNTKDTYLRVNQETRQWQEGKVLLFDDSFEHEVWHNGTGKRMVLIVDVWHPDLTPQERRTLPAI